MNIFYILIFAFGAILGSCQRSGFQPEAIDQDYITFGKGGGMANQVDTYYILRNGKVYHHNKLTKEYTRLDRLNKPTRTQCFNQALALPDSVFGYNEPGNIYYFLNIHADTVKQCTWGRQQFTPADDILSFYQYAQALTNNQP
ncbi:MAG: hypothetical protein RIG62_22045 [Cyclobacteriaceae bacterium]